MKIKNIIYLTAFLTFFMACDEEGEEYPMKTKYTTAPKSESPCSLNYDDNEVNIIPNNELLDINYCKSNIRYTDDLEIETVGFDDYDHLNIVLFDYEEDTYDSALLSFQTYSSDVNLSLTRDYYTYYAEKGNLFTYIENDTLYMEMCGVIVNLHEEEYELEGRLKVYVEK